MDKLQIKREIKELLLTANPNINVEDENRDIFSSKCGAASRDLLFVCMEMKKKYPIDYNKLVDETKTYSLNELADGFFAQM